MPSSFPRTKSKEHAIDIRFEISQAIRSADDNAGITTRLQYLNVIQNEGLGIETIRQRLKLDLSGQITQPGYSGRGKLVYRSN